MNERKTTLVRRTNPAQGDAVVVVPASAATADKELVKRSVAEIRNILANTVSRGIDEIGRYLLREFFDDDPRLYFSGSPNKHASLRLLIDRAESIDLPVSRTFLANALRLAAVTKGLPRSASFLRLPASHRVELLRLKEPERVERIASHVVEAKLSVQKLRKLIQKEDERRGTISARGRRRRPELLRSLEACLRVLRDEETGRLLIRRGDISHLTDEQLERSRTALAVLEKRVAELRRLLS